MNNVKTEALLLVGSVGAVGLPPSVIKIKSTGFNQSSVALQVGTQGQQTIVFNQSYASIRNAVLSYSCARDAVFVNGKFDSPDGACGTGNSNSFYSLNIGGQSYFFKF